MKTCIEHRHLGDSAQNVQNNVHAFYFGANVKWRKRRHAVNGRAYFVRDYDRLLKMRSTMDHTVPDHVDLRRRSDGTRLPVTRAVQQVPDDLFARRNLKFFFELDPLCVFHNDRGAVATPFDSPLPQGNGWVVRKRVANFV